MKPISLRIGHAKILSEARAALGRGREQELKQAHNTRVIERARATVARAKEENRLKRCAVLAAQKAIMAICEAYAAQDKVTDDFDRERCVRLLIYAARSTSYHPSSPTSRQRCANQLMPTSPE